MKDISENVTLPLDGEWNKGGLVDRKKKTA
jgi:hypothetical protein